VDRISPASFPICRRGNFSYSVLEDMRADRLIEGARRGAVCACGRLDDSDMDYWVF
jgi:hypothetical protein